MYKVEQYFTLFTRKFIPGQLHHFQEAEDRVVKELLSLGKISKLPDPTNQVIQSSDQSTIGTASEVSNIVISSDAQSTPAEVVTPSEEITSVEGEPNAPGEQHTSSEEQNAESESGSGNSWS